MKKKKLQIFLCHSSSDKEFVRSLYNRLLSLGCDPWLDEKKLLPGQKWEEEIPKAVKKSHIVIICLSKAAINKRGYIQKEIRYALDVADEIPENEIFIIPLKIEPCVSPDRLSKYHWTETYNEGYEKLIESLTIQAKRYKTIIPSESIIDVNYENKLDGSINMHTLSKIVNTFIDNYDKLTLPLIVELFSSDRFALITVLSPLIQATESMNHEEKLYWFDLLPHMGNEQVGRLFDILGTERRKLFQLEIKYQEEINALNEKHSKEWEELQNKKDIDNQQSPDQSPDIDDINIQELIDQIENLNKK